jgi:hypothetical protein
MIRLPMPLTVIAKSAIDSVRKHREALVHRACECLHLQSPDRRLMCFLDDEDWQAFKDHNGIANRGFYARVRAGDPHWRIAPFYILERVFVGDIAAVDEFVYLHGSTCSSDLGLIMTVSHELQHFIQRSTQTRLRAANSLIPNLRRDSIEQLRLQWCDLPHEREARIVAKRSAEQIFGAERVQQHIASAIAARVTESDATDWECIRGMSTAAPFDLAAETRVFFPRLKRHRAELEEVLRHFQSTDPDYANVDLTSLLGEEPR